MLTSLQNPWVKQLRKLHQAKGRREAQLSLLEGTHLLEVACEVRATLVSVACTSEWLQKYPGLAEQLQECCQRFEVVSREVLQAIATTVHPDGVVATMQRDRHRSLSANINRLGLVLETLQDPGNLGTLIRTSAAVGADGIWLSADSVDLDHPKVLRASAGNWFRVPMAVEPDLPNFIAQCRQNRQNSQHHCQIIATTASASQSYWDINWRKPSLILLGNEGGGLSSQLLDLADREVSIPIHPGVESLNVAIAAALILYEAQRQLSCSDS